MVSGVLIATDQFLGVAKIGSAHGQAPTVRQLNHGAVLLVQDLLGLTGCHSMRTVDLRSRMTGEFPDCI